jgi:hypothetical protein
MFGAAGPDLLTVHHVLVAVADCVGRESQGLGAGAGSVTPKACGQAEAAGAVVFRISAPRKPSSVIVRTNAVR